MLVEKMNRKNSSTEWNNFGAFVSGKYFNSQFTNFFEFKFDSYLCSCKLNLLLLLIILLRCYRGESKFNLLHICTYVHRGGSASELRARKASAESGVV